MGLIVCRVNIKNGQYPDKQSDTHNKEAHQNGCIEEGTRVTYSLPVPFYIEGLLVPHINVDIGYQPPL